MTMTGENFQALYQVAQQWALRGYFAEAIGLYSRAIDIEPNFAEAFFERAMSFERLSDYDNAISDYRRFLELGAGMRFGNQAMVEATVTRLDLLRRSGTAFTPDPAIPSPIKFPAGRKWW